MVSTSGLHLPDTPYRNNKENNLQNIKFLRCKSCHLEYKSLQRNCDKCPKELYWKCECGFYGIYNTLYYHDCKKFLNRKVIKARFHRKKRIVQETIEELIKN